MIEDLRNTGLIVKSLTSLLKAPYLTYWRRREQKLPPLKDTDRNLHDTTKIFCSGLPTPKTLFRGNEMWLYKYIFDDYYPHELLVTGWDDINGKRFLEFLFRD